eukprot:jgi/Botrbrau1/10787/Bobra.0119s0013.1
MSKQFITEKTALLQPTLAGDGGDLKVSIPEDGHEWLGSWYNCFGDCGLKSWFACITTVLFPFVPSGLTVRSALKASPFVHILIYLVCFLGVHEAAVLLQSYYVGEARFLCQTAIEGKDIMDMWNANQLPKECFTVGAWATATGLVDFAAFLLGVYFLARRRSQLREKFGIAGSLFKDFCLYCWCLQCAICQEYRTMLHNNVRGGIWHGPSEAAPYKAPAAQEMV